MRQGGQREHRGHGVDGGWASILAYIIAVCGLLGIGLAWGIGSAVLWLEPSLFGLIMWASLLPLTVIVLGFFLATMATKSRTGGVRYQER